MAVCRTGAKEITYLDYNEKRILMRENIHCRKTGRNHSLPQLLRDIRGTNMGFLKQFFQTVLREGTLPEQNNSFESVSPADMEEHLAVSQYGRFQLTDAIRPSFDLKVIPEEGFRLDEYRDTLQQTIIPVVLGSVSKEKLFDTFMDLLDSLGDYVDVVLESSHFHARGGHIDFIREAIDLPVLKSILYDYEDLLTDDGCTGIAVLNSLIPREIQFDEHKLLVIYGENSKVSERVFQGHSVFRKDGIRFLTEAEHVHSTRDTWRRRFGDLRLHLGAERLSD